MRTILILPLAGVVAIAFTAGCVGERESQDSETMGPSFAPQPAVCDTKDLSKTARSFFPRDFEKEAQDLISVLAEECAAEPVGKATDEAFDVMALMEAALGGVSDLDPVDGAALATGLLPFMEFMNCESSGCVEPVFANDVLLALSERGAFAVRGGPGDPADDVVERDAVDPGTPRERKWVIMVSTQFGCAVGCPMCDVGTIGYNGNCSFIQALNRRKR